MGVWLHHDFPGHWLAVLAGDVYVLVGRSVVCRRVLTRTVWSNACDVISVRGSLGITNNIC